MIEKKVNIEILDEVPLGSGRMFLEGEPFYGIAFEKEGGSVLSQTEYRNGFEFGTQKIWYSGGQIESENFVKNGILHGPFREWFENGTLKEGGECRYGIVIWRFSYSESGELIEKMDMRSELEKNEDYQRNKRIYSRLWQEES